MVKANEDLHRLRGCGPNVCTSLDADDAAIFVALYEENFDAVAEILDSFEEVTSLVTNVHKTVAATIQCTQLTFTTSCIISYCLAQTSPSSILGCPSPLGASRVSISNLSSRSLHQC
jgi:hypothetical protein